MSSDAWVALGIYVVTQVGTCLYFAGVVKTTMDAHAKRLDQHETQIGSLASDVAFIKGKEAIQL